MSSAYPVALLAARSEVDPSERARIALLLYSYIVRRGICGLSTKSINAAFQRIAGTMKAHGITAQSLREVFSGQTRDAIRFPDDTEFTTALRTRPLYRMLGAGRLQDVLWELELASRTALMEKLPRPTELSIEHVLPQRWGSGWPFADGEVSSYSTLSERAQERNHRLNTLGNLTLVTGPLNSSLGNADFASKKKKLDEHSLLALNKPLLGKAEWAEQQIEERAAVLMKLAVQIWPCE